LPIRGDIKRQAIVNEVGGSLTIVAQFVKTSDELFLS
jgi:hypothetical protein